MKRIFFAILIFLFVALITGYAQFFKDDNRDNNSYPEKTEEVNNYGGFFRSESPSSPGTNRPGHDEGIGVTAPLDDGVKELIICCIVFGVVIFLKKRRQSKAEKNEQVEGSQKDNHS